MASKLEALKAQLVTSEARSGAVWRGQSARTGVESANRHV